MLIDLAPALPPRNPRIIRPWGMDVSPLALTWQWPRAIRTMTNSGSQRHSLWGDSSDGPTDPHSFLAGNCASCQQRQRTLALAGSENLERVTQLGTGSVSGFGTHDHVRGSDGSSAYYLAGTTDTFPWTEDLVK